MLTGGLPDQLISARRAAAQCPHPQPSGWKIRLSERRAAISRSSGVSAGTTFGRSRISRKRGTSKHPSMRETTAAKSPQKAAMPAALRLLRLRSDDSPYLVALPLSVAGSLRVKPPEFEPARGSPPSGSPDEIPRPSAVPTRGASSAYVALLSTPESPDDSCGCCAFSMIRNLFRCRACLCRPSTLREFRMASG
jgi:hypothetical protein